MSCKRCSQLGSEENKYILDVKKCFFHTTKDIMMNNDLEFVKNGLTNCTTNIDTLLEYTSLIQVPKKFCHFTDY